MSKLTYEEWCKTITTTISVEVESGLLAYHGLNAHEELEVALEAEYRKYLTNIERE
jgi:hypothetical protein